MNERFDKLVKWIIILCSQFFDIVSGKGIFSIWQTSIQILALPLVVWS